MPQKMPDCRLVFSDLHIAHVLLCQLRRLSWIQIEGSDEQGKIIEAQNSNLKGQNYSHSSWYWYSFSTFIPELFHTYLRVLLANRPFKNWIQLQHLTINVLGELFTIIMFASRWRVVFFTATCLLGDGAHMWVSWTLKRETKQIGRHHQFQKILHE